MVLNGMKHDTVSFVGVLSACATISAIKQGKEIHAFAVRRLFHEHLFVSNSLLDLNTKCERIDLSRKVFDSIENRDVASWNTMIFGYGMLGDLHTVIDMFEAMREDGVEHDSVSYIAVLSACSHGGLVDKGKKYFNDMLARNIEPSQMHYACMVDLRGRSGLMDEATNLITGLPFKPDSNVWAALLGACRLHGNVDLGSWAAVSSWVLCSSLKYLSRLVYNISAFWWPGPKRGANRDTVTRRGGPRGVPTVTNEDRSTRGAMTRSGALDLRGVP
ncbi:hypothetical protein T459_31549 [Capsicum annuum]|uniref:Pentatricopeptide repeat-containing protein n=1 Tax=Capsicum annuum TaxID=4072 RepID=A0A2G2YBN0_CAPAN|nr:hypothetical protein T459_31549 [Capsicum annuum]